LLARGITSVTEPGIGPGSTSLLDGSTSNRSIELYATLASTGRLELRVDLLLLFSGTGGASATETRTGLATGLHTALVGRGIDGRRLRIAGVKVFADGTPRSHSAWFEQPYGVPHDCGAMVVSGRDDTARADELAEIIRVIDAAGLQAGVHATGDATAHAALDAMQVAMGASGPHRHHYVIHGDFIDAGRFPGLAAAGIGWSTNPAIARATAAIGPTLLGRERHDSRQAIAEALDAGMNATIASDAPVVDPDWRVGMHSAITRPYDTGSVRHARSLTTLDALAAMTVCPADLDGTGEWRGTLMPGAAADFAVVDAWPDDDDVDALLAIRIDRTVIDGTPVFERQSTSDNSHPLTPGERS
ncbi:MAG: amidohydrolase family protein, partial [Pseudoclavibacter sp.]